MSFPPGHRNAGRAFLSASSRRGPVINYYERHLGDYARDTAHLSMLEHGAYTALMDRYYYTERGIPDGDRHRLSRARSRAEKAAVDSVLAEFFNLENGVWVKRRIEAEIEKFSRRVDAARKNGSHGGRPRNQEKPDINQQNDKPAGLPLGSETETQPKAHQAPYTTRKEKGRSATSDIPASIPADVWADWHAYRNSMKGWTAKARTLSANKLAALQAAGNDPRKVVDQSIERAWTGLFPLRGDFHGNSTSGRKLSAVEQVERAIRDRRETESSAGLVTRDARRNMDPHG